MKGEILAGSRLSLEAKQPYGMMNSKCCVRSQRQSLNDRNQVCRSNLAKNFIKSKTLRKMGEGDRFHAPVG